MDAQEFHIITADYHCPDCKASWSSDWDCSPDDDCPECGVSYSPEDSHETPATLEEVAALVGVSPSEYLAERAKYEGGAQ